MVPQRIALTYRHFQIMLLASLVVTFFSSSPLAYAEGPENVYAQFAGKEPFSADELLILTNAARQATGITPLTMNKELTRAAEAKAADMVAKGYWDHFRPSDHKAPWSFIEESGYSYKVAGENLARGFRTPTGITRAWLNSPTHRANIMSPKYTEVGFASIETVDFKGQTVALTVQMFGSR